MRQVNTREKNDKLVARIPPKMKRRILEIAKDRNCYASAVIREMLREALEKIA